MNNKNMLEITISESDLQLLLYLLRLFEEILDNYDVLPKLISSFFSDLINELIDSFTDEVISFEDD